jgi:hypothetical protein
MAELLRCAADLHRDPYQGDHRMRDEEPNNFIECPLAIHGTDFGVLEDVGVARTNGLHRGADCHVRSLALTCRRKARLRARSSSLCSLTGTCRR